MTKRLAVLAAAAGLAAPAAVTQAAELEIEFTGMDLFLGFDGLTNIQSGPVAGDIDELTSATFYLDGVPVGTIVGDIESNIGLPGFDIPASGGTAENKWEGGYFSLDLDTTDNAEGFLNLAVDASFIAEVFYTGNEIGLSLFGENTGILDQQPLSRLPEWPGFDEVETVRFSFVSTNLTNVETDGAKVTQFQARGAGTLFQVPEPALASVLSLAGLGLLRRRR
jgi:hypothetical protein